MLHKVLKMHSILKKKDVDTLSERKFQLIFY